ncbi:MAG: hypothetical protein RMH81_02155 [Thermomicrobium sp.]|nr:hypothetical protein [Thermomicrobium sp.]
MDPASASSGSDESTVSTFVQLRPGSENDRLLAALGYVFWIVIPAVVLLSDLRRSTFAYVHALQGLVFGGASVLFLILYSCLAFAITAAVPLLGCILWPGYFLPLALGLYYAYRSYTASETEFPVLSDATRALFRSQLARVLG